MLYHDERPVGAVDLFKPTVLIGPTMPDELRRALLRQRRPVLFEDLTQMPDDGDLVMSQNGVRGLNVIPPDVGERYDSSSDRGVLGAVASVSWLISRGLPGAGRSAAGVFHPKLMSGQLRLPCSLSGLTVADVRIRRRPGGRRPGVAKPPAGDRRVSGATSTSRMPMGLRGSTRARRRRRPRWCSRNTCLCPRFFCRSGGGLRVRHVQRSFELRGWTPGHRREHALGTGRGRVSSQPRVPAFSVAVSGDYAYVACIDGSSGGGGLQIIDVACPRRGGSRFLGREWQYRGRRGRRYAYVVDTPTLRELRCCG